MENKKLSKRLEIEWLDNGKILIFWEMLESLVISKC